MRIRLHENSDCPLCNFYSVADPGCLSRIPDPAFYPSRIPDPGSRISDPGSRIPDHGSRITDPGSRIPDPGSQISDPKTATKERGEKKFVVIPFYVATNFTKLKISLGLKCWRKIGSIFKELYNILPKKLSLSSQKYGLRIQDPRSRIRKKPIPDPGSGSETLIFL